MLRIAYNPARRALVGLMAGAMFLGACAADDGEAPAMSEDDSADDDSADDDSADDDSADDDSADDGAEEVDGLETPDLEEGELLIGYAPGTFDFTDFFGLLHTGIEAGLDEHGVDYEIVIAAAEQYRQDQQMANVENLLLMGVDYLIVAPTIPDAQLPAYRQANEEGTPLLMGQFIEPIDGIDVVQYSGASHEDAGRQAAAYIIEYLGGEGSVAILSGESGSPVDEGRVGAAIPLLEEAGIEIVAREYADFDRETAYRQTEDILVAHPDVDFIYGASSAMALGAMSAAEAMSVDVPVLGVGGTMDELEMVLQGRLTATLLRDPHPMGFSLGEAIALMEQGRDDEIDQIYEVEHVAVDSCEAVAEYGNAALFEEAGMEFPPDC